MDLSKTCNIFPLNHLYHRNKVFKGRFTYLKSENRSQIDFTFTNREGLKHVCDFSVITENWHLSDHLPITVSVRVPESINCSSLLRRAKYLNYEYDPHKDSITRYLSTYDCVIFERNLQDIFPSMDTFCRKEIAAGNIDNALTHMRTNIENVYKISKVKKSSRNVYDNSKMKVANDKFNELRNYIDGENVDNFEEKLSSYNESRKEISKEIYNKENERWDDLLGGNDSKKLWEKINWKG